MIEIFIPVLFVCLNGNCNFMQSQFQYKTEAQCRVSVDNQKTRITEMAQQANQDKITLLEGTCVNAHVEDFKRKI